MTAIGILEPVDRGDVLMVERRKHLRVASESRKALRITCQGVNTRS